MNVNKFSPHCGELVTTCYLIVKVEMYADSGK